MLIRVTREQFNQVVDGIINTHRPNEVDVYAVKYIGMPSPVMKVEIRGMPIALMDFVPRSSTPDVIFYDIVYEVEEKYYHEHCTYCHSLVS